MYGALLVPTDGSRGAEEAIDPALNLAGTTGAVVHVLAVVDADLGHPGLEPDEREEVRRRAEEAARDAVDRVQERAAALGVDTVLAVREGRPFRAILDYVDENDVDLVVMGTAAERGRTGSTTERVVTLADVPVMAVPLGVAPESVGETFAHLVIPTDGSDTAERAADSGIALAERYGAEVHVVYVVDTTTYGLEDAPRSIVGLLKEGGGNAVEWIAAEARDRDLAVTSAVLRGKPAEEVLEYARGVDADVIAMGTSGRSADGDRLLGSTTARIVRQSTVPVLTVP